MTVEKPGFSRRRLLTTAAVGVPAVGLLGAVNLFGASAAKAQTVAVDGWWGEATTSGLWKFLRYVVFPHNSLKPNTHIVYQPASQAAANPGLGSGWDWVSDDEAENNGGSPIIRMMQWWLGMGVSYGNDYDDGMIGPYTISALQNHYGLTADGVLDGPSPTISALQTEINKYVG